ncbi:zinc finger imprinted 3-like isoform X2 [Malaya genurostris]|uniref:zinc finger imprinted 3-like isoform X2 n=1 Tax=Malaya genurostris TaxID=325434 RepID=UPI0026F37F5E|nr:zinc finger imprinted 3-like isoform X2 [Malaya genurostris]
MEPENIKQPLIENTHAMQNPTTDETQLNLLKYESEWIDLGSGYQIRIPAQGTEHKSIEQGQFENVIVETFEKELAEINLDDLKTSMFHFVETRDLDESNCFSLRIKLQSEDLSNKQVESFEDFVHKCNFCISRFSIMEQLRGHLLRHAHIECDHCNTKFHNPFERDWHAKRFHRVDSLLRKSIGIHHFCRCCQLSFPTNEEIFSHLIRCHWVYVEQEMRKFSDPLTCHSESTKHLSTLVQNESNATLCIYCNQIFKTSWTLAKHFKTKHMSSTHACKYCTEVFSSMLLLIKHQRRVHGIVTNYK